ncbi:hypothetical protein GV64_16055 [Endozoicomonas elysicola]|uniref:Uncharacterized protein n=1 Tax=Endozoicomonas elysicola TaxID=305900 RepID=A0A081KD08_9GAMM|nr:hypothetical protein GV64_16055 [Endozoicomonas elysicola]
MNFLLPHAHNHQMQRLKYVDTLNNGKMRHHLLSNNLVADIAASAATFNESVSSTVPEAKKKLSFGPWWLNRFQKSLLKASQVFIAFISRGCWAVGYLG